MSEGEMMARKVIPFIGLFLMLAVLTVLTGCSKEKGHTVAQIGDRKVMIEDLNGFFERRGIRFASAEQELQAKRDLLDSMINQNLLIIGAYEKNLENHEDVAKMVEGEKIKFLLDVLFEKEILSKAVPSEADIKEWYARMGEEIKASHIVVDSLATAEDIIKKLKEGGNFEELAVQYSLDPQVKRNQGDLDWFTWGRMVDNFQKAAFQLQPGEISAPVKTEYGYHIIKLVDRRKNESLPSYDQMKEEIRNLITERRKGALIREYADRIRAKYPVTIEKPTCQFVLNKLEFLYPENFGGRPRPRNDIDPTQLDAAEKELVLGKYEGGKLTLGVYLDNLRRVPPDKRPDFDQYDSLLEVVFQMAFRDMLGVEARSMGLENDDKYKSQVKLFKELAMADVLRNDSIPYGVVISDADVQAYYDAHQAEFTTPLKYYLLEIQVADENQANALAKTIKSEAQFMSAAAKETLRPGKKQVSGELGFVTREQYPDLFDAAARLTSGQMAGPVATMGKYSLIWVKQRLDPVLQPVDLVKGRIIDQLTKEKGDALYTAWIDEMKKRIAIHIYDNVLVESVDKSKYATPGDTTQAG
jgi:peptidyl-prolyl cis-trans isomerase C